MYASQDAVNWTGFWIFAASLVVIAAAWSRRGLHPRPDRAPVRQGHRALSPPGPRAGENGAHEHDDPPRRHGHRSRIRDGKMAQRGDPRRPRRRGRRTARACRRCDGRRHQRPGRRSRTSSTCQPRPLDRGPAAAGVRRGDDQPRPRGRAHDPIERAYASAAEGRVLNYGFSASWTAARGAPSCRGTGRRSGEVPGLDGAPRRPSTGSAAPSPVELGRLARAARARPRRRRPRHRRADGVRAPLRPAEYLAVAALAARAGAPTYTHVRRFLVDRSVDTDRRFPVKVVIAAARPALRCTTAT